MLGGDEERFAQMMTLRARALGMTRTTFRNASGLPDPAQVTTARDLSLLCRALILTHPHALKYTSTRERTFRPGPKAVVMRSHNHLLNDVTGCDGLKTGYITKAGFSVAVTAARNGKRLVVVVLDSIDRVTRDKHAKLLVDKGFGILAAQQSQTAKR